MTQEGAVRYTFSIAQSKPEGKKKRGDSLKSHLSLSYESRTVELNKLRMTRFECH